MISVQPYTLARLRRALASRAADGLPGKLHVDYFEEYFDKLKAKTLVVETDYVDRDWLEDFSAFYVRCFPLYDRWCTRLHFFDTSFDQMALDVYLGGDREALDVSELQRGYLGFVVVKPLPRTVVGRTCLKVYPSEGLRHYPILKECTASLAGIEFVLKSLPYQEQDAVAAACATSALWSAFHACGGASPSPIDITRAALDGGPVTQRGLPNHGLTLYEMARAVQRAGFEPEILGASDQYVLCSTAVAYLRARIPIVLVVALIDTSLPLSQRDLGLHAITVAGYSLDHGRSVEPDPSGFRLRASGVAKLYGHDDQVGPFARLALEDADTEWEEDGELQAERCLTTSWRDQEHGALGAVKAFPLHALIPLYHKIRIPFSFVLDATRDFDVALRAVPGAPWSALTWDIWLTNVNDLKRDIVASDLSPPEYKREFLTAPLPRFVWRATAADDQGSVLELLFDATDIEQSSAFARALETRPAAGFFLRALLKAKGAREKLACGDARLRRILDWFGDAA